MSSINNKSSSKKYTPLFADNADYEYDSSPPTSPVRRSSTRTRVRKGLAPERLEDSDGTSIVVRKANAPLAAAATTPGLVVASAPRMGDAIVDSNFSGLSPPDPNRFVEPFPLAHHGVFYVVSAGTKVGITPHWALAQNAICCDHPSHLKMATFALAVEYYRVCHAAGLVELRSARSQPRVSPASPGHSPDRKRQRIAQRPPRLFAIRSGPPPLHPQFAHINQPYFAPINRGSTSTGTSFWPISVPSSPVVGGGDGALLPAPIITRTRPIVICSDSDDEDEDENLGYSAAHRLSPAPTTLDPRIVFASVYHGVDSGDDGASIDLENDSEEDGTHESVHDDEEVGNGSPPSTDAAHTLGTDADDYDSAITISDDEVISISDSDFADDNAGLPSSSNNNNGHITTNPATPATPAISSSLIVEDGSDSDWGFESIDDPEMIREIGRALDDPFGFGAGDGRD